MILSVENIFLDFSGEGAFQTSMSSFSRFSEDGKAIMTKKRQRVPAEMLELFIYRIQVSAPEIMTFLLQQ